MRYVLAGIAVAAALTVQEAAAASHSTAAVDGQRVYARNCASCHRNEDPKLGDKAAWKPLIAQGADALIGAVIKGKGKMPPRGGKPRLSDQEIQAAVDYMISKSK